MAINAIVREPPSGVELDVLDLAVPHKNERPIQPCLGCVSTAGGFHCAWSCTCWGPGSAAAGIPDFMHDADVYGRLEDADGFIVFTPIHWYSVPTQLKAMFDRLVCANLTITRAVAVALFGGGSATAEHMSTGDDTLPPSIKDPKLTKQAQRSGRYDHYLKNHLEGKVAGFFVHGDAGADDYIRNKRPASYLAAPKEREPGHRCAIQPLVWQCRYSGIFVPDDCVETFDINQNVPYADQNDKARANVSFADRAGMLLDRVVNHIKLRSM